MTEFPTEVVVSLLVGVIVVGFGFTFVVVSLYNFDLND
jgi:hypothetical protein